MSYSKTVQNNIITLYLHITLKTKAVYPKGGTECV